MCGGAVGFGVTGAVVPVLMSAASAAWMVVVVLVGGGELSVAPGVGEYQ